MCQNAISWTKTTLVWTTSESIPTLPNHFTICLLTSGWEWGSNLPLMTIGQTTTWYCSSIKIPTTTRHSWLNKKLSNQFHSITIDWPRISADSQTIQMRSESSMCRWAIFQLCSNSGLEPRDPIKELLRTFCIGELRTYLCLLVNVISVAVNALLGKRTHA